MNKLIDEIDFGSLLIKGTGMVLFIIAVGYAVQHPHSFVYYLIKFLVAPIP